MNAPDRTLLAAARPATPPASPLARRTLDQVQHLLGSDDLAVQRRLELAQRQLNRWRQQLLVNTYLARQGDTVHGGPFAGMRYTRAAEGATLPRYIGCYEAELHPHLLRARDAGYETVIDIGCAEGYYAVGLARLLPGCTVHAHDTAEHARTACQALAELNGVADRVKVGGLFNGADFARHTGQRTLVFCDIEGAEDALLDPEAYPALRGMDLIVEVHECFRKGLVDQFTQRFAASHDIEWVWQSPNAERHLPGWTDQLAHFDQVLCTWEWRSGPTPWAVMRAKSPTPAPAAAPAAATATAAAPAPAKAKAKGRRAGSETAKPRAKGRTPSAS